MAQILPHDVRHSLLPATVQVALKAAVTIENRRERIKEIDRITKNASRRFPQLIRDPETFETPT